MSTRAKIPLSDFITLQRGFDLPTARRKEGNIPVIASTGIAGYHNKAKVKGPGVVIGRSGSIGGGQYAANDFWPLNTTLWVKDFKGNNPRFTYYLLKGIDFTRFNAGAGVPTLNRNHIASLRVSNFSPVEQARIASTLSAYDDLIENNCRRIRLLEESARLLYREWFVRLRFPGHEHVKIIDGVPEGWKKKALGELVEIKKGKNITKDTANEGDVPVVAGGLTPAYFHDTSNAIGPVITISASGANAGYVNIYHEDIWASDCSYISQESTDYLYYYFLLLKSKQKEISGLQRGAAQPHVYPKDLMGLTVISPPNRVVESFGETISNAFLLIKNLTKQNKSLAKARDLLLPRLMNGETEV